MRWMLVVLGGVLACGKAPDATPASGATCPTYAPQPCEEPFAPPDAARPTGSGGLEVSVDLPSDSDGGVGRMRYWVTGERPVDLYLTVRSSWGAGAATGAFFVDGRQAPVRVDGGDASLTFQSHDGWMTVELASPPPTGMSLGSLVLWVPGHPGASAGHSLTLIHDACGLTTELPASAAEVTTHGVPGLLDPQTDEPLSGEPTAAVHGSLGIHPCLGGSRSVGPLSSCTTEDYLLVALVDGKAARFEGGSSTLHFQAPAGSFAESTTSVEVPSDRQPHEVLLFELPSYRRYQVPGSSGTLPIELGRYLVTGT